MPTRIGAFFFFFFARFIVQSATDYYRFTFLRNFKLWRRVDGDVKHEIIFGKQVNKIKLNYLHQPSPYFELSRLAVSVYFRDVQRQKNGKYYRNFFSKM